jgi:cell division topological specificity factor
MASSRGSKGWWGSRDQWAPRFEALKDLVKKPPAIDGLKEIAKKAPSIAELREKVKRPKALDNVGDMVKQVFEKKKASRQDAHNRLKAVMLQDRTTMTAEALVDLRNHIILLLANFVPVDRRRLEMDIKQSGGSLVLTANVRVDLDPQDTVIVGNGEFEEREWLLSPKRTAALRRDLLDTVGSYMPIFPDSAEVREEHFSTYVMVYTGLRIADGVGFDEKARRKMAVSFVSGDF